MENSKHSMTALISAFSRAYHSKNNKYKVLDDYKAIEIIRMMNILVFVII